MANTRLAAFGLLCLFAAIPMALDAQTATGSGFDPMNASIGGVHLYSVSAYSGDYIGGGAATPQGSSGGSPFATGLIYGGSANFGWTHTSDKSSFSAGYSPSYFGSVRDSKFNTLNHQFNLHENVKFGKWNFTVAAAGVLANLQQLLFNPTVLTNAASVPSTFDDLAAAMVAGKYTNAQLAAILTGSPLPSSPEQSFIYGQRLFSASLTTSLSWAPTTRSSLHFALSGTRAQTEKPSDLPAGTPVGGSLLGPTTAVTGTMGWSYSLTPRTQVSLDGSSTRVFSRLSKGYMSSGNISLAHTLSRSLFVQLSAGGGILNYTEQAFPSSHGIQYLGGASLGYKVQSHTFLASFNRSVGDTYGIGANATNGSTVAWHYRHPGSAWSLSSSFEYQQLVGSAFQNSTSWRTNASVARSINAHLFMSAQYGYYHLPASLIVAGQNLTQSGIVLMMSWTPSTYR